MENKKLYQLFRLKPGTHQPKKNQVKSIALSGVEHLDDALVPRLINQGSFWINQKRYVIGFHRVAQIGDATKLETIDLTRKLEEKDRKELAEDERCLVVQSTLSKDDLIQKLSALNQQRKTVLKQEKRNTRFLRHRSTWMGMALLIAMVLLILVFALTPVMSVLLAMMCGYVALSMVSAGIAFYDAITWLSVHKNFVERFKNWLQVNQTQAIITGVGIVLAAIGLGLFIGFSSMWIPTLTLAAGGAVIMLAVGAPLTIADAINRCFDQSQVDESWIEWKKYNYVNEIAIPSQKQLFVQKSFFEPIEKPVEPELTSEKHQIASIQ